jgi:CRP-like cAMP-binding protein
VPFYACDVVFAKDDLAQAMVIVSAGRLELLFKKMSVPIRPGDCLGDYEVFSDTPRYVGTLLTSERAEVYTMQFQAVRELEQQFPREVGVLRASAREQMHAWERSANIMMDARGEYDGSRTRTTHSDVALVEHRLLRLESVHLRILDLFAVLNGPATPNLMSPSESPR